MPGYNDTPGAADRINDTQAPIRQNFNTIDDAWQINHVDFTDAADYGKHAGVDLIEITDHPTVDADNLTFYNFENAITIQKEVYVKRTGALGVEGTPFTASVWDAGNTRGWTYLPSGLLVKWGLSTALGTTAFVNADAPYYTTIYSTQVTPKAEPTDLNRYAVLYRVTVNAGVSFTLDIQGINRLSNADANCDFYWMTIGV